MPIPLRACQIDACSRRVPVGLTHQGVCLNHDLEEAFTRVASALELCHGGQPIDSRTLDWMLRQGDFAVRMLSKEGQGHSSEERARLLELLLGLANVLEHVRRHSFAKAL